jgi:hypothetical protein
MDFPTAEIARSLWVQDEPSWYVKEQIKEKILVAATNGESEIIIRRAPADGKCLSRFLVSKGYTVKHEENLYMSISWSE